MVLYRKVGYEPAGAGCYYSLPTAEIGLHERLLDVRSVEVSEHAVLHELYDRFAAMVNGHIDRSEPYWQRKVDGRFAKPYAYIVGPEEAPEGYLIFDHDSLPDWGYRLRIRDLVALTPEALRTLWALVADHRSLAREVRWAGAATDLRTCVLPEQKHTMLHAERWLLRIVNVARALEGRGYPAGVQGELHLDVTDGLLGENEGLYRLRVEGGRADVERGGRGDLAMDVRGLSALYTGHLSPRELRLAGLLDGPEESLESAARLFAGPEPWMQDNF
jgi:predicted acetyltransferase